MVYTYIIILICYVFNSLIFPWSIVFLWSSVLSTTAASAAIISVFTTQSTMRVLFSALHLAMQHAPLERALYGIRPTAPGGYMALYVSNAASNVASPDGRELPVDEDEITEELLEDVVRNADLSDHD